MGRRRNLAAEAEALTKAQCPQAPPSQPLSVCDSYTHTSIMVQLWYFFSFENNFSSLLYFLNYLVIYILTL